MSTSSEAAPLSTSSEPVASSQGSIVAVSSSNFNVVNSLTHVANPESQIPEIPNIPTELLIPPRVSRPSVEKQTATGHPSVAANHSPFDVTRLQDNIENLRSHIGRETNTLADIQNQLTIRAHDLERVREELKEYEDSQLPSNQPSMPSYNVSNAGGGGAAALSNLSRKKFAQSTGSAELKDTDQLMREYRAQLEDLQTRLRLTTSLCSKQETYYRDIITELENRLRETIAGRDHVLALREAESANQLHLIHQLESALNKQQRINNEKEELVLSYGTKIGVLEESLGNSESALEKLVQLLNEAEKKRGRNGFVSDSITARTPTTLGFMGQSAAQALQRCLHEDEGEKQVLKEKLSRLEGELVNFRQNSEQRHFEQQKHHENCLSKIEDDNKKALESVNSKKGQIEKQFNNLQDELSQQRKAHEAEVAVAETKIKSLDFELEMIKRHKGEVIRSLESKCLTLEETLKETKIGTERLQSERDQLMTAVSQEQAKNANLREKLSHVELQLEQRVRNHAKLEEEYESCQNLRAEEIKRLDTEMKMQEQQLKETYEKLIAERKAEAEALIQEERDKSNARLDNIIHELNNKNEQITQLKSEFDIKSNEIKDLNDENSKKKEQLELREKEIGLVRQNMLDLVQKLEEKQNELTQRKEEYTLLMEENKETINSLKTAENSNDKLQTQLEEREKTIQSFQQQGANLAEILETNNKNGDSLQREREQLVQKLQQTICQVEEMKKHRELLARKLKAKDKRTKELEEENEGVTKKLKAKEEELAAMLDDRDGIETELKMRQREVTELRDERKTLNALLEGKDGEKEKEINQLLSRLKGSEQDLNLTRKLLKAKRDISGKAVRVAESMQQEVTCKRGEVDTLQSKLHWMKENLDSVVKDKKYLENKCKSLFADMHEVTLRKDKLEYEVGRMTEQTADQKNQIKHLEQALEKAALKHADSQAMIEKLEQDIARLKLKHSSEVKEVHRNLKNVHPVTPSDAATILSEIFARSAAAGLRFPAANGQSTDRRALRPLPESDNVGQLQGLKPNEDVSGELKSLLQDMRTLISSFQGHAVHATHQAQKLQPHEHAQFPQHRAEYYEPAVNNRGVPFVPAREEGHPEREMENNLTNFRKNLPKKSQKINRKEETANFYLSSSALSNLDNRQESVQEEAGLDFIAPLHSSSPKRTARDHKRNAKTDLPSFQSEDSDDSCVSSLLFNDHPKSVNSSSPQDQQYAPSVSSALSDVSPLSSGQRSVSPLSVQSESTIGHGYEKEPFWKKRETRQLEKPDNSFKRSVHLEQKENSMLPQKSLRTQGPSSEPAHKRAEKMLELLAQTGSKLTKTNKEIETLLKDQDKKIQKCRKKERKIQALTQDTGTQRRNVRPQR